MSSEPWEAVVVGAGPAGLSAAFWLGRYRRRVLVVDDDRPRNEAAWAVHGYPGIPDPEPRELRRRLGDQARTAGAVLERRHIREIGGTKGRFTLRDDRGTTLRAGRIVLAYGRQDRVPDVPGLAERLGTSVFHCPDCDGPSVEGRTVAVLGHDRAAASLALYLLTWAQRAILMTDGRAPDLDPRAHRTLRRADVEIVTGSVDRLLGPDLTLSAARVGPDDVPIDGLFFHWGSEPTTDLAATAGLDRDPEDVIRVDPHTLETSTPGIYAAGDIIGQPYLAISAAAQGVRAALAAHRSLLPDDFRL